MSSSFPPRRRLAWAFLGAVATAAGGGAVSLFTGWVGGIAHRGYVDGRADAARDRAVDTCRGMVLPLELRVDELEGSRITLIERLGLETRARVGFQVALHYASDPRRRASADSASRAARAKYDALLERGVSPAAAADKVLEEIGVPR